MKQYISILQTSPFFSHMAEDEILSILHCIDAHIIKKSANSYLWHANETGSEIGIVLSGSALVVQEDVWGNRHIVTTCHSGELFGEPYATIASHVPRNVSVIAKEDCTFLLLQVNRILSSCPNTCSHHSRLIQNLVFVLSNKLLYLHEKLTHMSKRTTREKLLSYLSSEAVRQNSLSFDIVYDRQQLADYLCVERAAMSAELSKLQREGFLTTKKKHFELSNTLPMV